MTYKSILVQVEPNDHALSRLKCAALLAARFEAGLIGLAAECVVASSVPDPYNAFGGEWAVAVSEQLEANFRASEENFRSHGGAHRTGWTSHRAMPADALIETARRADLIVAGGSTSTDSDSYSSADVGKVVLASGRPVIVAPPDRDYCSPKSVLVASRDTREARRAVADALPFLKGADDVLILEICDEGERTAAQGRTEEVAAALVLHGVKARGQAEESQGTKVCRLLIDRAAGLGADLIVSGAYGHSRLGEWVFGGVTRGLLRQTGRFVLFSN